MRLHYFIILGLMIVIIALFLETLFPRTSVHEQNNYHTSAFRNSDTPDSAEIPNPEQTSRIPPRFTFFVNAPHDATNLLLQFRYHCHPNCGQIWLTQDSYPGDVIPKFLIRHPILDNLSWFAIWDTHFFLYQKHLTYKSISEFIANPPEELVLTEQSIHQTLGVVLPQFSYLENTNQLGSAEYILTTYQPVRSSYGWSKLAYPFDIQNAPRDTQNNLPFTLHSYSPEPDYQITITQPQVTH